MESTLEQPLAKLPASCLLDHSTLHLLPCGIHHDGKANINGFFFLVDGQYPSSGPALAASASAADKAAPSSSSLSSSPSQQAPKLEISSATTITTETTTTTSITESSASITPSAATTTTAVTTTTAATTVSTTSKPSSSSIPEVSFRGRTLKGSVINLPEGYQGSIYKAYESCRPSAASSSSLSSSSASSRGQSHSDNMDMDGEEEYEAMLKGMQEERKTFRTEAQFNDFMMWGHDEQPTRRNEKVVRAMQWFDIANVLHEPLW